MYCDTLTSTHQRPALIRFMFCWHTLPCSFCWTLPPYPPPTSPPHHLTNHQSHHISKVFASSAISISITNHQNHISEVFIRNPHHYVAHLIHRPPCQPPCPPHHQPPCQPPYSPHPRWFTTPITTSSIISTISRYPRSHQSHQSNLTKGPPLTDWFIHHHFLCVLWC